jgi:hypothetical protein
VSEPEDETSADRDRQYAEVSLRAVELLARAQRTADEAVAEAQAYARDLEASARAQYNEILHRAQVAARELQRAGGATEGQSDGGAPSAALTEEIEYVRTYARVAHAQLKTVLSALTDELDNLAAVAAGRAPEDRLAADVVGEAPRLRDAARDESPSPSSEGSEDEQDNPPSPEAADNTGDDGNDEPSTDARPTSATGEGSHDDRVWPPIFDEQAANEPTRPSMSRNSFQRR